MIKLAKKKKKTIMTKEAFDNIKQDAFNDELEKIAISYKALAVGGAAVGAAGGAASEYMSSGKRDYKGSIGAGALTGGLAATGAKGIKRLAKRSLNLR